MESGGLFFLQLWDTQENSRLVVQRHCGFFALSMSCFIDANLFVYLHLNKPFRWAACTFCFLHAYMDPLMSKVILLKSTL
jgi:hypothetical protein